MVVLALLLWMQPSWASPLTPSQRAEAHVRLQSLAREVARSVASGTDAQGAALSPDSVSVSLEIAFDEERAKRDGLAHTEVARKRAQEGFDAARARQLALVDELAKRTLSSKAPSPDPKASEGNEGNGSTAAGADDGEGKVGVKPRLRMGLLNLDVLEDVQGAGRAAQAARRAGLEPLLSPPLAIHVTAPVSPPEEPFIPDPMSYIKSVKIGVFSPRMLPDELKKRLGKSLKDLFQNFGVSSFSGEKDLIFETPVTLEPAPAAPPAPKEVPSVKDHVRDWLSPRNPGLSVLVAALALAAGLLVGLRGIAMGFLKLSSMVGELKPKEDVRATEAVDAEFVVPEREHAVTEVREGVFDPQASADALAGEMHNIREEARRVFSERPSSAAEAFADLLELRGGPEDLRDLLGFVGADVSREAFQELPPLTREVFSTYLEENRNSASNLLQGVEVTRRLLQGLASEVAPRPGAWKDLGDALCRLDDNTLGGFMRSADASATGTVLARVSVDRSSRLSKRLAGAKLREALDHVDMPSEPEALDAAAGQALEALTAWEAQSGKASSSAQSNRKERFVLRMFKTASLKEEDALLEVLPEGDVVLRARVLEQRFPLFDACYLPPKVLKGIVDGLGSSRRMELVAVAPDALRKALLALYEAGTTQREILDEELETLQKSEKRRTAVEKSRWVILEAFMERVRIAVGNDASLVAQALAAYCQAKGFAEPDPALWGATMATTESLQAAHLPQAS
jgi:hypothetical protein